MGDAGDDPMMRMRRLRVLQHLLVLLFVMPVAVMAVLLSVARELATRPCRRRKQAKSEPLLPEEKKVKNSDVTVLLTGGKMTKSLHFAKWFWQAGYRVVMTETPKYWHVGTRTSRSIAAFHIIPDPRVDPEGYKRGLAEVAKKEGAKFFVPVASPAAAVFDAEAGPLLRAVGCTPLHFEEAQCKLLDNKHDFCIWVREELKLAAPESFLVRSDQDARELNERLASQQKESGINRRYVLKNLEYDALHRLDLFTIPCSPQALDAYLAKLKVDGNPITSTAPWEAQRFLSGQEYAAFAVLREGHVRALTVSRSSASQLNYEHTDERPDILAWMEAFAAKTGLTGNLCFDFIVDGAGDGLAYPIECNPRIHTQCSVFLDEPGFGEAVLAEKTPHGGPLLPPKDSPPVYWFYNELFKWLMPSYYGKPAEPGFQGLLHTVMTERDAQFDPVDPLPFLVTNFVQVPRLLLGTMYHNRPWKKVDFAIGKVVELNGD